MSYYMLTFVQTLDLQAELSQPKKVLLDKLAKIHVKHWQNQSFFQCILILSISIKLS